MDLTNTTPFHAALLRTTMGSDHLQAAVIVRATFRIEGGQLVATPEDPWPIEPAPFETPAGTFPADAPFLSGGVDVFVVGSAYQPGGAEGSTLEVDVRVGEKFEYRVLVIGDRIWERGPDGLVPSEPQPFVSMPLSYEYAYGGKTDIPEGEMTCLANPLGKGFYVTEQQAEGSPLPNLEDPASPIVKWDDQPDPVGPAPYPEEGSLRILNAAEFDAENLAAPKFDRLKPTFFNRAHPKLIIEPSGAPKPGDAIVVTHTSPDGDLRFVMPDLELHVHVQLEDRNHLFPLHLDQIGILSDDERVLLSYRTVFRYRVVPMERRMTTLHLGPLPEAVPDDYVQVWED